MAPSAASGGALGGPGASAGGRGGSADGGNEGGGSEGGGEGVVGGGGGFGDVNWSDDDALDAMVDDIGREVDGKRAYLGFFLFSRGRGGSRGHRKPGGRTRGNARR